MKILDRLKSNENMGFKSFVKTEPKRDAGEPLTNIKYKKIARRSTLVTEDDENYTLLFSKSRYEQNKLKRKIDRRFLRRLKSLKCQY